MQPKAKANSVCTSRVNETNARVITFTVLGAGHVDLNMDKVSKANLDRATVGGLNQRCINGAALPTTYDSAGKPIAATPLAKFDAVKRIVDHLNSGSEQWELPRANAVKDDAGMVIRAMLRAGLAKDVDEGNDLITRLATKRNITRDEAVRVWTSTSKVASAIADIKAEELRGRAKASTESADDLIAELTQGEDEESDEDQGEGSNGETTDEDETEPETTV